MYAVWVFWGFFLVFNNATKSLNFTKGMSGPALKKKSEKPAIAPQLLLTSPNQAPRVSFQPG